ncbi:Flp pilus assembly protein TadD, contains TPR repeats [Longilinea arvoryzae]|uniref:Flp pilus assembly protein TadD, contains TPR repeats n=1 Tax=Longilinea arvoryzae TaxID=360412 RepID=A0A0S7BAV0_9CHLR|nr:tetratricopeptide repeat protein [Longilinea arvoryzae]GAP14828.1 Flp pilus assembly protein TadD, contains TPR repeats [Longilinea arvoryzae]
MQTKAVLSSLKNSCDSKSIPETLIALRHDPLVWKILPQLDLEQYAQRQAEKQTVEPWCPANLALFALETDLNADSLRREPLTVLDGNLQRRALAVFEETLRTGREPADLKEAGLLALALRERRRKTRSWTGLTDDLLIKSGLGQERMAGIWESALACLYTLIPDRDEILKALLDKNPVVGMGWCLHILLSNPAGEDEQARKLTGLIIDAPLAVQSAWLARLQSVGREALAGKIARMLLADNQTVFDGLKIQYIPSQAPYQAVLDQAAIYQQAAVIYQCAGASLQAAGMLEKAQTLLAYCLAGVQIQNAVLDAQDQKTDVAVAKVEKAYKISQDPKLIERGASILHQTGLLDVKIPSTGWEPEFLSALYLARQMAAGDNTELARQTASRAVEEWLSERKNASWQTFELDGSLAQALNTLVGLDLLPEATRCADAFLQKRPNDPDLLQIAALIEEKQGEYDQATADVETMVMLQPQNMQFRRELAHRLEDQNQWTKSLEQRQFILENTENAGLEDQLALANCAIQAGEAELAVNSCDQILAAQPEHGIAHTLKGQALLRQGKVDDAVSHLSRATLLCADSPRTWLALSEAQQKKGDTQRALDTLRAAILAVPDSSEVHFQLARMLLDQGYLTDALPYLRQAARLSPEVPSVTTELAKTLRQLGHHAEAAKILSEARQRWPKNAQLAYLEALTLQDLGNRQKALESLEIAVKAEKPEIEWLQFYVQMYLQTPEQLYAAMPADYDPLLLQRLTQVLQKILAISPTDFTARMWMADLLRLRGQTQAAFDAYQQLLDECGVKDESLHNRVQAGFGAAALAANELDTALACLQEVLQKNPEDLGVMHLLAETYLKSNLAQETARAAGRALQMEPDQVDNLVWYSNIMERLGNLDEAQRALETAVQLSPERSGLWLKRAQFALAANQPETAEKMLAELEQLSNVSETELRQAASFHLKLEDYSHALACMKKIEATTDAPSAGLLCDLAFLSQRDNDFQGAMVYAEKAVKVDDQNIRLHVLQADLLAQQTRTQAALACLEKAARLMESKSISEKQPPRQNSSLFTADNAIFNPAAIYSRSAVLLKKQGDISGALFFAEKALDILPDDLSIRLLMAGLAYSQLQFDHVLELTAIEKPAFTETLLHDDAEACWQTLQALRCELLLEDGNEDDVSGIVNPILEKGAVQPRMKAIQARLLARNGEYAAAGELFDEVKTSLEKAEPIASDSSRTVYHLDLLEYAPIWLGEVARDLYRWDAANRYLETGRENYAREAVGHYQFASLLVQRSKATRLCDGVHATTHNPNVKAGQIEAFENALLAASQFSGSPKISELRQIGKLVLPSNAGQFKHTLTEGHPPTDKAALVIGIAQGGNTSAVLQAVEQAGDQPEVYAQAAVYLMSKDAEKAMAFAQQAVELEPRQPLFHALRAVLLSKNDQPAEEMEAWQSAIQIWPDEPIWQAELARLSQALGDPAAAIQHWEAAHTLQPEQAGYTFNLGVVFLETRNYGKAIDVLETASRQDANNPQCWLVLAEAHLRAGHFERALQCAQRAAAVDPDALQALLMQGEILIQMGNLTEAQSISDQALKHGSTIPEVVIFNVHLLEKRGKLQEALAALEQASGLLTQELVLQVERLELIRQVYGSAAALPAAKEALKKFPNSVKLLAILATVQYECGDSAGAEKSAQHALRYEPNQANLQLLMGQIKAAGGQLDQAVYHLTEAVQLSPVEVEGYLELGKVYQERREQEKAIVAFQQAIRVAPTDTRAYVLAAAALRDAKDYSSAEKMLRKAAELAPNDLNIRRQLGAVIALNLVQHSQEAQAWH